MFTCVCLTPLCPHMKTQMQTLTHKHKHTSSHIRYLARAAWIASEDCVFAFESYPCQHTVSMRTLWWRLTVQRIHMHFLTIWLGDDGTLRSVAQCKRNIQSMKEGFHADFRQSEWFHSDWKFLMNCLYVL